MKFIPLHTAQALSTPAWPSPCHRTEREYRVELSCAADSSWLPLGGCRLKDSCKMCHEQTHPGMDMLKSTDTTLPHFPTTPSPSLMQSRPR